MCIANNSFEFMCIAHRGAMGHAPENTLLSIQKAIELGSKYVEIDVHIFDDEIYVIHDDFIITQNDEKIYLGNKDSNFIKSIDIGSGQNIPTLNEILDCVNKRCCINIELKGDHTTDSVSHIIRYYVKNRGWEFKHFIISSFKLQELMNFRNKIPQIDLGLLISTTDFPYIEQAKAVNARYVNISFEAFSRDVVEIVHRNDMKVLVYTVNTKEDITNLKMMGADGIFTNFPELCL